MYKRERVFHDPLSYAAEQKCLIFAHVVDLKAPQYYQVEEEK